MDDSLAPRGNIERASSKKELVDSALAARLKRMEGAHYVSGSSSGGRTCSITCISVIQNGLENLPFFGMAILAANFAGLDAKTVNVASGL